MVQLYIIFQRTISDHIQIALAMKERKLIIELHYMPTVLYFALIDACDYILIEASESFQKQTFRNRCLIRGANKIENLIVPIRHPNSDQNLIQKIQIDCAQPWLNKHLRAINTAYGKAPFFEFYVDELVDVLNKKHRTLFNLNLELLTKCLEMLGIEKKIALSSEYNKKYNKPTIDARNAILPKKPLPDRISFDPFPYQQVFGKKFADGLSILDLIFCEGPGALDVIRKSKLIFQQ